MRFRWPRFWVDNFQGFNYHLSWQERRRLIIGRVEDAGFGWWIVTVAGVGFLTDAYDIFAINTVIPMIGTVYWKGSFPTNYQFALNASTLLGSMFGQVVFGILADKYGRRKMYGLELVVTIIASLNFAGAATGVFGSMSIIAWLIFWRLVMGAGIGADYPLSGVITSEFAPTRYRGRMIAAVFFWQPIGQLLAAVLALAATEGFRTHILKETDPASCSVHANPITDPTGADCARTVDQVWRLVAGLGAVPAAIAIVFRLTIPESVYWVLDVKNDSNQAMQTRDYWPRRSADAEINDGDSIVLEELPPDIGETLEQRYHSNGSGTLQDSNGAYTLPSPNGSSTPIPNPTGDFITLSPPAKPLPTNSINSASRNHTPDTAPIPNEFEDPHPREQSFSDFINFFWTEGNWTDLLACSLNWMLLDFTFYLLGVNSSRIIPSMFSTPKSQPPFSLLVDNEWHTLVATSIGAVLGGAVAIKIMNNLSRRIIQMWSFLILAVLFVIVGALYVVLLGKNSAAVIVTVYVLCQFFFNAGPNTTTFIIPAESFPTRYRTTCHGISAAAGKLGSVLGQIVVTRLVDDTQPPRVGYLLISFFVVMVAGAAISKWLTPETCDIDGKSRTLEELSFGKKYRKELEAAEAAARARENGRTQRRRRGVTKVKARPSQN